MDKPIQIDRSSVSKQTKKTKDRTHFWFLIHVILSVAHLPIIEFKKDTLGLFDIYIFLFCLVGIFYFLFYKKLNIIVDKEYLPLLIIFGLYLVYCLTLLLIHLLSKQLFFVKNNLGIFSLLLFAKQVQYFVIFIINVYWIKKINPRYFQYYLYLTILMMMLWGVYKLAIGEWYRLGVIGDRFVSSNPAGFIFMGIILALVFLATEKKFSLNKVLLGFFGVLAFLGLTLTFSRTNNIAAAICVFFFLGLKYRARLLNYLPLFGFLIGLTALLLQGYSSVYPESAFSRNFSYLINPTAILDDGSFAKRVGSVWWSGMDKTLGNPFYTLFGTGIGSKRLNDGLYTFLFNSFGLVGMTLYLSLFIVLLKRNSTILIAFALAIFLNGITTETTVLSFRSMQVFLIILAFVYETSTKRFQLKMNQEKLPNAAN